MNIIAFQRVVKYFIQKKTIESYGKLTGKKFQIADNLTGSQGWCDFLAEGEWGECTDAFQSSEEAKYLLQHQFSLDASFLEKEYQVQIEPNSIPSGKVGEGHECRINTLRSLEQVIQKKLHKEYLYASQGYPRKGTLLVGIFDPSFCGFQKDPEITLRYLNSRP